MEILQNDSRNFIPMKLYIGYDWIASLPNLKCYFGNFVVFVSIYQIFTSRGKLLHKKFNLFSYSWRRVSIVKINWDVITKTRLSSVDVSGFGNVTESQNSNRPITFSSTYPSFFCVTILLVLTQHNAVHIISPAWRNS